ncbi:MAG: hypothetical protein RSE50_01450 [Myroides sp.]
MNFDRLQDRRNKSVFGTFSGMKPKRFMFPLRGHKSIEKLNVSTMKKGK